MSNEDLTEVVNEWKTKRFRDNQLTLTEAALSLATDSPSIEVKFSKKNGRWMVSDPKC